ncbi:phosphoribosylformylglycinamidine cyclo-ligase [Candidatus Aerophobetes bacterium]|nr:phosphoribosylformylglycinamidine cyclo-ligase [Candidatus Aerophobetes bacterium]
MEKEKITYKESGVDAQAEELALKELSRWTKKTFNFRDKVGSVKLELGYFANVVDIGQNMGIAISTDGVGSKILIAQLMEKYDTIGIDCVAMNVNDVVCVGAEPISMVDYLAVSKPDPELLYQIGKGLYEGAKIARVNIPGGEIAQVREMIKGERYGHEFDLVGTAIGVVDINRIITGKDIKEKELVMGFASSGVHSNGLTLARCTLLKKGKLKVDSYIPELQRALGDELLEPTLIYVPAVVEMLKKGLNIKALIHVTGDGLLNLNRVASPAGYILDNLPSPQLIFSLIQKTGDISDEEMFAVFNMGIGFCVIIPEEEMDNICAIAKKHNFKAQRIGYVDRMGEREVIIPCKKLKGKKDKFVNY